MLKINYQRAINVQSSASKLFFDIICMKKKTIYDSKMFVAVAAAAVLFFIAVTRKLCGFLPVAI